MIVRLLLAVLIGLIVAWVAGLLIPGTIATLLGVLAGALYFFEGSR